jgi:RNA-directed DNA polymerase
MRRPGIPAIRDRVVQGAPKPIPGPVFEADFQDGSYGYRPGRTARQAAERAAEATVKAKTRVTDPDLKSCFDSVRHAVLPEKAARRVRDGRVPHLLKPVLKANGSGGVPQGGVPSPLSGNIYLNGVDCMPEKAKGVTREGKYTHPEYARYADDPVIPVDGHPERDRLWNGVSKRLREVLAGLQVEINERKQNVWICLKKRVLAFLGLSSAVQNRYPVNGVRIVNR